MFVQSSLISISLLIVLFSISMYQKVNGQVDYTVTTCSSPFEDISASGSPLSLTDDDGAMVPIGFNFIFYGVCQENVSISSNGYMTFGGEDDVYEPLPPIPNAIAPNNVIAPLWMDLDPDDGADGEIDFMTIGTSPNMYFVAQWTNIPHFKDDYPTNYTFQAVLFEQTNCIEFRYDVIISQDGVNSTIGIENPDGSDGEMVDVDPANLEPGDCYGFCPQETTPPVITCPANITVLPNESSDESNPSVAVTGTAMCSDSCGSDTSITFSDTKASDSEECGNVLIREWICADEYGNESTCQQEITTSCDERSDDEGYGSDDESSDDGAATFNSLLGQGNMDNDFKDINDQNNVDKMDEIDHIEIAFGNSVYLTVGICGLCLIAFGLILCAICKQTNKNQEFAAQIPNIDVV